MVNIIERNPSFGERLARGAHEAGMLGGQLIPQEMLAKKERQNLSEVLGKDVSQVRNPALQQQLLKDFGQDQRLSQKLGSEQEQIAQNLEQFRNSPMYNQLSPVQKFALEQELAKSISGGTAKSLINAERETNENQFLEQLFGKGRPTDTITEENIPGAGSIVDETFNEVPNKNIPQFNEEERLFLAQKYPKIADQLQKSDKENRRQFEADRTFNWKQAEPFMKSMEDVDDKLLNQDMALDSMERTLQSGKLGLFSLNTLAELTGVDAFLSPEGKEFKSAAKEYFLNDLTRAGARPNQWVEQQIASALPGLGTSVEGNLTVHAGLKAKRDILKKKRDISNDLMKSDMDNFGYVKGDIGKRVNQELKEYAQERMNDLRDQIKAIQGGQKGGKTSESENEKVLGEIFGI